MQCVHRPRTVPVVENALRRARRQEVRSTYTVHYRMEVLARVVHAARGQRPTRTPACCGCGAVLPPVMRSNMPASAPRRQGSSGWEGRGGFQGWSRSVSLDKVAKLPSNRCRQALIPQRADERGDGRAFLSVDGVLAVPPLPRRNNRKMRPWRMGGWQLAPAQRHRPSCMVWYICSGICLSVCLFVSLLHDQSWWIVLERRKK